MRRTFLDNSPAFACLLDQVGVFKLAWVVGLYNHGDSVQGILQCFAGTCVHHARLQPISDRLFLCVWSPHLDTSSVLVDVCDECDLRPR